jgi:hypothetical protein
MFKKFGTLICAVALACFIAMPASAAFKDMWAQVYSWDGKVDGYGKMVLTEVTSGITFVVLQRNSDTEETLYEFGDSAMTSLTNPVTTTNFALATVMRQAGEVSFRVDPGESGDTYVDLIVTNTAGGYSTFVEDFTENIHAIVIDERANVPHVGAIWFKHTTTSEVDTGIDFDYDTLINDVRIEVVETCAACTIDAGLLSSGTNGDADGFRDGTLLTTAGFVADTGIITDGSSIDYYADSTYGDLLYTILAGADTMYNTVYGGNSYYHYGQGGRTFLGHVVTGANEQSLTYTVNSTTTGEGYIFYEFMRLR